MGARYVDGLAIILILGMPMFTDQTQISNSLATNKPAVVGRGAIVPLAIAVLVAFNGVGLLLVIRRFAGALSEELPREAMLLTAIVAGAVVACLRISWRKRFPLCLDGEDLELSKSQRTWDWLIGYGSSLSLVLLAVGCCFPANHTSDWLIWLPLLVADQIWRQSFFDAGDPERGLGKSDLEFEDLENELILSQLATTKFAPPANALGEDAFGGNLAADDSDEIVQQLYRVRDELGQEVIYGSLRADFLAGQRTAVVHAGFCPPLSHLPEIEAESFRGPDARIKVVQALAHGTRMDVRLATPASSDCHVWIDMSATPASGLEKIKA